MGLLSMASADVLRAVTAAVALAPASPIALPGAATVAVAGPVALVTAEMFSTRAYVLPEEVTKYVVAVDDEEDTDAWTERTLAPVLLT